MIQMTQSKVIVNVGRDFSKTPGPRYEKEGDFAGELFRKTILFPKYEEAESNDLPLVVDLDGTAGFGTSFLEEAFGGLIRENNVPLAKLKSRMTVKSDEEPDLLEEVESYMTRAEAERQKDV